MVIAAFDTETSANIKQTIIATYIVFFFTILPFIKTNLVTLYYTNRSATRQKDQYIF